MTSRTIYLKELLSKTIEPAILVVDEKLSIQYHSLNVAYLLKLPKNLTTLKQLENLNKLAFTSIAKKAIHSIKYHSDVEIFEDLILKNKNYPINLKIQKLQTDTLEDTLYSICISKCNSADNVPLNHHFKNSNKNKVKEVETLESKLTSTLTELNWLKKENERLKSGFETSNKNLEHIKTEYEINLGQQHELNFFMTEMLKNSNFATVFLNLELEIIKYTPLLSKLFDVENRDIGRKITDFNHVFETNDWVPVLQKAKNSDDRIELELTAKNDQYYLMTISPAKFSHVCNNVLSVSFVNITSQVKANQDKIASEQKFKTLFESGVDGMAIVDLDTNAIIDTNKKMPQMLGFSKEIFLKTNPVNFLPEFQPDGTKSVDIQLKNKEILQKKGSVVKILAHKHQTKGNFFARVCQYLIPHPTQNYAAVVLQNVNKEIETIEAFKKNELELKATKDRYSSLFENAFDGIVVFNLTLQKVVDINNSLVKMCGFSKTEIIAKGPIGIMTEFLEDGCSTLDRYVQMMEQLKTKKESTGEFIHLHKTKAPFHIKVKVRKLPKPNQHLAFTVIKNIDAQKKAETKSALNLAQLKASESRHKAFFNQSLDGQVILNKDDMMPVEVNRRMLQILRISKTEYFASSPYDFFDVENNSIDVEQIFKDFQVIADKKIPFETEVYIKSSKRKSFLVKVLINQLPAPNQHLVYAVIKDIDKERKAEEAATIHLKALAASESMFKTFFNNGLDGFGIAQIFPKPKPIEVNSRMLELTGLSKKEFINSNILDFMSPVQANSKSGKEVFDEITQSLMQKGFYKGEVIYTHKKKGPFYANITMVRLKPPNDNKIFIQVADKDKEVKALQQVAKSEALFKSIFANSLDGILIYDIDKFIFFNCNAKVLEIANCTLEEFKNTRLEDFLPKNQPNGEASFPVFKKILKTITESKSINKEFVFKKYKTNELVYARISLIKLSAPFTNLAAISIADITERKLTEKVILEKNNTIERVNQELSISLKKYKDTFDNSANFIGRLNLKGKIIEHNLTVYDNVLDKSVNTTNIYVWNFPWFKNHKDSQTQLKQDFELAKQGQPTKSQVLYNISPNFSGTVEYTFKPLKNEQDQITAILAEASDVTQQVNAIKKVALNEQKFRAIFNNSTNFIGIFTTRGVILELNETVTDSIIQNETEAINIPLWDFPWFLNHKDTQQAFKKAFRQAAKGVKVEGIVDYTISPDFSGTMQFSINPIFDDKGKVVWILGEGKDITEIINKNKILAYKEQKFRAIFNNSSNLIGLYDKEGYIEELNQPLLQEIEESQFPGAFPKIKMWNIPWIANFKESQQAFIKGFKKALKGEVDKGIVQYAPKPNQIGIFEYTLSPIFDDKNKVIKVLGEGKDITEKLQAQKEIEASEKRFRDLFYNAENIVVRLSPEGKVIEHNRIIKNDKNFDSYKKYMGRYFWELIDSKGNQKAQNKLKLDIEKARNGQFVSDTIIYNKSEHKEVQLAYSLKPVFGQKRKVEWILSEAKDITEVIKTQRERFKNEQKFRAIFNNSSNFMGLYSLDGTIEELNKPIIEKIPKSKRKNIFLKMKLWELPLSDGFKKTIKQSFKASLKKVLKGEVYQCRVTYSLNAKEDVCLEIIFSPVFDEHNKVFKVLGEGRDVTEQANSKKQIEVSEKRFKALFVNAENVIVRLSPEGRVIEHNKIVKSAKNYDRIKKYIGKYLWELSGVFNNIEAQIQLKKDIKKAAKGNLVYGTIFSKDRNYVPIKLAYSFKPIFGTDNKTVEWILAEARDVTDVIKIQNQLLENEQKFKAIFYNSENFVVRLDAKGNVLEHSRVHIDNPLYNTVKHYIGKPLWEFSGIAEHPESVTKLTKDIKACAAGKLVSNQIQMRIYKLENSVKNAEFKIGLVVYSLKPVYNKSNKIEWILAEAKDITELDEAKNKLSDSLNKYQKLFENNLVGIITLDENLKLIECNEAYEKITGYSANDTDSFDYYNLIDEEEKKEAKLNEHKIRNSKVKALQFKRTLIKKNGDKIFVHIYLKPIYVNNKFSSAVVTIADITELENKRNALKQSEELYKAVFDGVNDGLFVYDVKKNEIVTFNKQLLQIAGVKSKSQFLKEAKQMYIPFLNKKNKHKTNWIKKIARELEQQKIAKFDYGFVRKKGALLDISSSTIKLSDAFYLTAVTDITETKKAQNALLESEIRYRSLFENNVTGIALGNKYGQILQVNEALCAMFGYTKTEMLQLKHQDLSLHGGDDQSYTHFKAMVEGKSKTISTTKEFVKKNGDVFYAIIYISGIYDKQNNFKYNIASISDISELKHLEYELKEKQIELADKVVELEKYIESNLELENFAFIASHDLKSPTQTIINFSNLLTQKAADKLDEQEQHFLKYIVEGSNRLQNTINDLLNFSLANNNTLNIEKINLKHLINDVVKDLNSIIIKNKATIKTEELPRYNWIDKGLYKGLLLNLISNAIKFQKKGNRAIVTITCKKTQTGFLFAVKDNGIGIPKKSQHKIFGIFKRLHNMSEYEGTGIGLALCKKVVEKHKGKIWVESSKGKGATFYFTLPNNLKKDV